MLPYSLFRFVKQPNHHYDRGRDDVAFPVGIVQAHVAGYHREGQIPAGFRNPPDGLYEFIHHMPVGG